ncbi:hypothetical protein MOOR_24580 [Moorella thermoacetica]|uniref:Uncharacterized protein n=1 Tax=Neomoorella thermoacetica TaxID=1525 RepID=A0A1J5JGE1_NEOTH|nr:hypothetical protein MOOR_24580 [Moorella thermoacetica]
MHEDLILYATGGIGGQFGAFSLIVSVNSFYKPNGAYGYQIFGILTGVLKFFGYVGHQAQVMFN